MTFAEKLLARKAGLDKTVPGQIVTVKPDHLLMHDNAAPSPTKSRTTWPSTVCATPTCRSSSSTT